jgi:hypothetical protein
MKDGWRLVAIDLFKELQELYNYKKYIQLKQIVEPRTSAVGPRTSAVGPRTCGL